MNSPLDEKTIEQVTLSWFETLGYQIEPGPAISPGVPGFARQDYTQIEKGDRRKNP